MKQSSRIERVAAVLKDCDNYTVGLETIQTFFAFLSENLKLPCEVVTAGEYERYQLDAINNSENELFGLLGKVKLLADDKRLSMIPLCDLKAVDNRSKNFDLLNTYAEWFINYQ
ncbi:hypothetical protein KKI24_12245 [bacterium]|nr:hypothetical protein [bacterium]